MDFINSTRRINPFTGIEEEERDLLELDEEEDKELLDFARKQGTIVSPEPTPVVSQEPIVEEAKPIVEEPQPTIEPTPVEPKKEQNLLELDEEEDKDILDFAREQGTIVSPEPTPKVSQEQLEKLTEGITLKGGRFEAEREDSIIPDVVSDRLAEFGGAINTSLAGLTDLFGANNAVSRNLKENADWYRTLLSAEAQNDQEEVAKILSAAEDEGILDQLAAGFEAFKAAPASMVTQGLGSLVVFIGTGLAGRLAAAARAAKLGLGAAEATALTGKIVTATQLGTGSAMGAGIVKGEIYEGVKAEMLAQGKSEEEASRIASEAQAYNGKNLDMILAGGVLGAADGILGANKVIGNIFKGKNLPYDKSRFLNVLKKGILEEAPQEFVQAGQERLAQNLALQREGVDVDLFKGVFSQAALEGTVGAVIGGGGGLVETRAPKPKTVTDKVSRMESEATKQEELAAKAKTGLETDPTTTATERLKERSKQLEEKNIPNQTLKLVERQIEQTTGTSAAPVKTAGDILEEKATELDRKDTVAIELDEGSKTQLKKVAKNKAKPEEIKALKDKGYVYETEGELVITEGARLGMGKDAPVKSEKKRLEEIRDRFTVTNEELNNSTDEELLSALERGRNSANKLTGNTAVRVNESLNTIAGELSRRSKVKAETPAGDRETIDNRSLAVYDNDNDKSDFIAQRLEQSLNNNEQVDIVTPKGKKVSKVVGYDKNSKSFVTKDANGRRGVTKLSDLSKGNSRLEIFDPTTSRSRRGAEISEKTTQSIRRLVEARDNALTEIDDVRSTPLEGYDAVEGTSAEAQRKANILNQSNARNPVEFLTNIAKKGGTKGKVAEMLLKAGLSGNVKINFGRFGRAKDPNKRFAGKYNKRNREITINLDERDGYSDENGDHDVESTLLHELAHAAFVDKIENSEILSKEEAKAVSDLKSIYDQFVAKYKDAGLTGNSANALRNEIEFASEVLVNPEVQRLLGDLEDKTLLEKVLQYILNFITGKELNPYSELSQTWKALNTLAEARVERNIEQPTTERVTERDERRTEQTTETEQEQPRGYQGKAGGKPIPRGDIKRRARQFREGISRVYREHPRGKAVTVKDLEFYEDPNNTLFMSEDGSAGVAVTADADLVSVFKLPDSTESMVPLLTEASKISKTLDAYDINGFLPGLYSGYGFTPVARMKFNREYAPEGWTYDTLGEPDIVFMAKTKEMGTPVNYNTIKDNVPYVENWDDGVALQQKAYNEGVFGDEFFSPAITDTAEDIKARTVAGTPVGTRSPTAKKATESGVDANSVIDLKAARRDERTYKRNAILLTQYPHISKEFPTISNRFKEISKPLTDIENAIEEDSTKLKTAKEKLKVALAKKEGIAKSKVKGKRIEELIAQDLKQTEEEFRPLITEIKGLEENIANNKAEKKNISAVVNKELDTYVMEADITMDTADSIYEKMVDVAKSNLRVLFDLFPADLIETAKLWYDGANILAQEFAKRFKTNLNRASAVLAVFSPQKDWFMNISLAERAMNVWNNKQNSSWDEKMTKQYLKRAGDPDEIINEDGTVSYEKGAVPIIDETTGEIIGWNNWKDQQAAQKRNDAKDYLKLVEGKKLKDLSPKDQARFIRMYSEVYDSPSYHIYSPNGTKLGLATTDKGAESKVAWGGYNTIEKAIAILSANQNNEMEVISQSLGEQHKVRSFYNNIVDPQNKSGAVTMDTHAIGAATFMALSGNSREVTQNFGGGGTTKSSLVGANGLYAAFAEAYRRLSPELSRELGVEYLPREIQSVTWEAVRMLFPAKWKSNKKNVQGVRDIWKQYEQGKKSIKQVRGEIFRLSKGKSIQSAIADAKANGEGLGRPDWATDPRYGTDNIRRIQEADDTRGLPEGGRDTDGARRRARERGGVERATGVVSRPTEGRESGAVLEGEEFFSPAVTQFPVASKDAYIKKLPMKGFRWFFNGNLIKDVQRIIERQQGKKDRLQFKMNSIQKRLESAAKRDGVNYKDIADKVSIAFMKSPDGLSVEQLEQANSRARAKANKKLITYLKKNLTEDQFKELNRMLTRGVSLDSALKDVVLPEQQEFNFDDVVKATLGLQNYNRLNAYKKKSLDKEIANELKKENEKNRKEALERAKTALESLPTNLKNLVLDMRQEISELTDGAVKDGIIPADAKIIFDGKDTKLSIEELFFANVDNDFAEKLKLDKDTVDSLTQFIQKMWIENQSNKLMADNDNKMTKKQAMEIAASQLSQTDADNLVENFLNQAKSSPLDAFKKLSEELAMTDDQKLGELPRVFKKALKPLNDAGLSYIQMIYNIGQDFANSYGFNEMRNLGMAQGWIYDPAEWSVTRIGRPEPEGFIEVKSKIPGFSRVFKGLKVDPLFIKAIEERFKDSGDISGVNYLLNIGNSYGQAAVTIGNVPGGFVRQALGGILFLIHSGTLNSSYSKAFKTVLTNFRKDSADTENLKYTERLIELGILDQDINVNRLKDAIKGITDEELDGFAKINSSSTYRGWKKVEGFFSRFYQFPDSFFRASVFEAEKEVARKAFPDKSEAEIEEIAAERTKEAVPSYTRMNYLGRQLRKPGIQNAIGAFVGFGMEVIRVMHSSANLAYKDITNPASPEYKFQGYKRIAGMTAAYTSTWLLGMLFKSLANISDEEEEAARRSLTFNKNDDLIFFRNEDGSLSYFSLSFINPFAQYISNPIRAMYDSYIRNDDDMLTETTEAIGAAIYESVGNYLDPNIFTQRIAEVISNDKNRIYNPEDTFSSKTWDITTHLLGAISPATAKKLYYEVWPSVTGTEDYRGEVPSKSSAFLNLVVGKSRDIKPERAYENKVYELSEALLNSSRNFTRPMKEKSKKTEQDVIDAYDKANKAYYDNMYEAVIYYNDALRMGVPKQKIRQILKDKRISEVRIRQIERNEIKPLEISPQSLKEISEIDRERQRVYYKILRSKKEEYNLLSDLRRIEEEEE